MLFKILVCVLLCSILFIICACGDILIEIREELEVYKKSNKPVSASKNTESMKVLTQK